MIVVMPDGDNSFYMDRADGKALFPPIEGPEFVDGIRRGATGKYETYITKDLVDNVDSSYRTIADRDHRGIGGFSMGGIGSMFLLLRNPDVFSSVTSHSAVYTLTDWTSDPLFIGYAKDTTPEIMSLFTGGTGRLADLDKKYLESYDPYNLLRDFNRTDVHIYFDTGEKDAFAGMKDFKTIKKFAAGLEKKGLPSRPAQHIIPATDGNGNGMHTGRYWRSRVGVTLAFHARAFGLLDPATGQAVPDAQLSPDALGRALCRHGLAGDVRGIMSLVHPVQLEDFLASARDQGMDPEQFLAMIETEARKRPLKSCEVLDTAESACEPGGGAYESPAGAARNLTFERCGALYIRIVQDEEETTEQQIPAMKIQGRWYIDVPR
jgi:S-formylglutathione hydrolase FrmB